MLRHVHRALQLGVDNQSEDMRKVMRGAIPKQRMRMKPQAREFSPEEMVRLRALLRQFDAAPLLDEYLDAHAVAARLGFSSRTVRELAKAGVFDGDWGRAWKPQQNVLRIPVRGVEAYIEAHAAAVARVESSEPEHVKEAA